jgi:cell division protein FtsB
MAYVTGAKSMSELEKLKAQNAELADRIAKLEEAANPAKPVEYVHQRPDYTAGMSMGRSTIQAMLDGVPESEQFVLMQGVPIQ